MEGWILEIRGEKLLQHDTTRLLSHEISLCCNANFHSFWFHTQICPLVEKGLIGGGGYLKNTTKSYLISFIVPGSRGKNLVWRFTFIPTIKFAERGNWLKVGWLAYLICEMRFEQVFSCFIQIWLVLEVSFSHMTASAYFPNYTNCPEIPRTF